MYLFLAACGGGGGSGGGGGGAAAPPVSITSPAAVTLAENTQGTFYTATATGGSGTISFTIAGGADAAFFSLAPNGALSFLTAPNYDLEADADGDNVYRVVIEARSGSRQDSLALAVTVTNSREGIRVTRIATNFTDPAGMARTNLAGQLIVAERGGHAFLVDGSSGARTAIAGLDPIAGEEVVAVGFGPDNAFYKGPIIMRRSAAGVTVFRPHVTILNSSMLASGDASGVTGALYFDSDGRLFAAVGDPAGDKAQTDDRFIGFGKFFVQGDPYAGATPRLALDVAGKGLRAPSGFAQAGARLILMDQGGEHEHEVSLFLPTQNPINFGWPFFEGTRQLLDGAPPQLIAPKLAYPFGNGKREGSGPVGGVVYQGPVQGIANHFVFADADGTIWSIPATRLNDADLYRVAAFERRTEDFVPDRGSIDRIVALAADAAGTIYILDEDGELFRVDAG